ncbi:blood vessel epicardial substance [Caerostris extrusa]|uniref:Blood vessel epicardial substance n=1 Tax=Caerostris extrusa TaxID=172846 RepID=A0AAV4Y0B5_CAEEX|nr:blood vessel epicardial substance [Caerostris extrusa]
MQNDSVSTGTEPMKCFVFNFIAEHPVIPNAKQGTSSRQLIVDSCCVGCSRDHPVPTDGVSGKQQPQVPMHPLNDSLSLGPPRPCVPWPHTRQLLLQVSHFCLAAAFLLPTVRRSLARFASRLLLTAGFLSAGAWAALHACAGPDVLAWNATLLVANFAQALYMVYRWLPPRIAPELQEFYLKVFAPLKVGKDHFRQLVRHAHVEPLDAGEQYAMEGVTDTDQRLAVLLTGKMKVTCEDILLHYLLPTEFVDSPEWESCASNTDKRFQVTLTATEPCRLLCWGRKELLTLLDSNPFLKVVMHHLIGKDITHKLYSLNEQHRLQGESQDSIADSLEFWRSPHASVGRCHSLDMLHTGRRGSGEVPHLAETRQEGAQDEIHRSGEPERLPHIQLLRPGSHDEQEEDETPPGGRTTPTERDSGLTNEPAVHCLLHNSRGKSCVFD